MGFMPDIDFPPLPSPPKPPEPRAPRLMWRTTGRGPLQRMYLTLVEPGQEQPGDEPYQSRMS
jgi:hypothetical protein